MKVSEILKKEGVITATSDETLGPILSNLTSSHDAAFIFDEDKKLIGIINPLHCLIKSSFPGKTKVTNCLVHPPRLILSDDIGRAARLMIESKIHYLPVFDGNNRYVGIASSGRLLAKTQNLPVFASKIATVLPKKKALVTIVETDPLHLAIKLFKNNKISKLVVVSKGGVLKGVLSYFDLVDYLTEPKKRQDYRSMGGEKSSALDKPVKLFTKTNVLTLTLQDNLKKAIELILTREIGSVVIIDAMRRPIGIITTKDLLLTLSPRQFRFPIELKLFGLPEGHIRLVKEFAGNLSTWFARQTGLNKVTLKVEEKKQGGIIEIMLKVVRPGLPVAIIKKQGKNLSVVLIKFAQSVRTLLSRKSSDKK